MASHLSKAIKFTLSDDEGQYIYAALELRLAIEEHVYKKLSFYSKRHGAKLLFKNWQPNKALKILCQLEPHADKSYSLSIAAEDNEGKTKEEFKPIGRHEALSASWINKNYNKLGNFLHLKPETQLGSQIKKKDLDEVIKELTRVDKSSLISNISQTISFDCKLCSTKITCCTHALPELKHVYCQSYSCNARYLPDQQDKGWYFRLDEVDFKCSKCNKERGVLANELVVGAIIRCDGCKEKYVITGNTWQFSEFKS